MADRVPAVDRLRGPLGRCHAMGADDHSTTQATYHSVGSDPCSCTTARSRATVSRCVCCSRTSGSPTSARRSTWPTGRGGRSFSAGSIPALRVPTLVLDDGRPLGRVGRDPLVFRRGTRSSPAIRTNGRRCCSGCSSSSTTSSLRSPSFASGSPTRAVRRGVRRSRRGADGGRLPRARCARDVASTDGSGSSGKR